MSGRDPRRGGRGTPYRGRGDGGLAAQGNSRGHGAPSEGQGRGGRGDGRGAPRGGAPRGASRGASDEASREEPSSRKLVDDEYTPGTKIFRLAPRSHLTLSLLMSVTS